MNANERLRAIATALGWVILPLNLLAVLDLSLVKPHDFWWHVRIGELITATHHIPVIEPFSFTRAGQEWINQPWLMQLWLSTLYHAGGLALVVFAHAITIATGYTLLFVDAKRRGGGDEAALATVVGAAVGVFHWKVRPQGASFLMFGVLIVLLEHYRVRETEKAMRWKAPLAFALLFAVWSNLHGAFTFGLLVLGLHVGVRVLARAVEARRANAPIPWRDVVQAALVVAASTLACGLNPAGFADTVGHVLAFFEQGGAGVVANREFDPLTIRSADGVLFFYAAGRLVWAVARGGARPRVEEVAIVVVMGLLTLSANRTLAWFGMVLIGPLARSMSKPAKAAPNVGLRLALGVLSLGAFLVTLPWLRRSAGNLLPHATMTSEETAVDATRWLCTRLPDGERVVFEESIASFAEWGCPKLRVMVDTRIQAYPRAVWEDYWAIQAGRYDWEKLLAKWNAKWLVVKPDNPRALAAARDSTRFREKYADSAAVVFGPAEEP